MTGIAYFFLNMGLPLTFGIDPNVHVHATHVKLGASRS